MFHITVRGYTSTGRTEIIHPQTSSLSQEQQGTRMHEGQLLSSTKLWFLRKPVYQITYNNCNQHYTGSSTRFIHDRVGEHLNNDISSVKKHVSNKVYKGI